MTGHDAIISMRKQGFRPDTVWINDTGADVNWHRFSSTPEVEIKPNEQLDFLDLRWAVGLNINASITGSERAKQVFEALKKASPKRVICTACELVETNGRKWPEAVESWDTEGVIQWQK